MSIVLHPTAFSKQTRAYTGKLIPREESNNFVAELGVDTPIRCVNWPKDDKLAPKRHTVLSRFTIDVCNSDTLMPLTCSPSGSVEPQMIAEHKVYFSEDTFLIERIGFAPIILSGRSIIHVSFGHAVAVNKLATQGRFSAISHHVIGGEFDTKEYRIAKHGLKVKCVSLSVWEQPYRVKHSNAYLIAENGLLLG